MLIMKKIAVNRETLSVDRHFYDLFLDESSIRGALIWKTGSTFRGFFAPFSDRSRSKKLSTMTKEELLKVDARNFFIKYEDITGAVIDDLHKEIQLLTSSEFIKLHLRKVTEYEELRDELKKQLGEKLHPRDVEIKLSIEQGY